MAFGKELHRLSQLLKLSSETILLISCSRLEDRRQLQQLALEVDAIADRLRTLGSRRPEPLRS